MAERLNEPAHSDAPVFPDQNGGKTRTDLNRPWKLVCRAAGLPEGTRIHDLRHSVASLALQSGLSLPMIAGLLWAIGVRKHHSVMRIYPS